GVGAMRGMDGMEAKEYAVVGRRELDIADGDAARGGTVEEGIDIEHGEFLGSTNLLDDVVVIGDSFLHAAELVGGKDLSVAETTAVLLERGEQCVVAVEILIDEGDQ